MIRYLRTIGFSLVTALAFFIVVAGPGGDGAPASAQAQSGCVDCHEGLEPIRDAETGMAGAIATLAASVGDPDGCTVCHGGDPVATEEETAHASAPADLPLLDFYPDPGSIWIADLTCGQCHPGYAYAVERSLMQTEAGKIQGNMFTWTVQEDQRVIWGNYDVDDPDGPVPILGTEEYKAYITEMAERHPDQFPDSLTQLPNPTPEDILEDPFQAGFTYQRQQCQRCHVGIKGRQVRGDYRGMGCSACHIPYSNEGLYEGNDESIPADEPGHMLVHRVISDREAGQGIPTETCVTCHNRGKRIGVTFQGLMEFPYGSPYNAQGESQSRLHTKQYLYIKDDLHHDTESRPENPEGGLLCQDCHTTVDMHGDGNLFGTTLAQVEIECADCHGTPDAYPWELPIGYQEEFGRDVGEEGRGTTDELTAEMAFGTVYDPEDGYLLTTRGNPFGNVVRSGDDVIVHSATGLDFTVPLLKTLRQQQAWVNESAAVGMVSVGKHMETMECYSCHADWAPQCYGCHVKVDYSGDAASTDWVAIGSTVFPDGQTIAEHPEAAADVTSPGAVAGTSLGGVNESRSYLRWEEPILGINGEGRVTPLMPGCQVVKTVIGPDGELLLHNALGTTPPGTEGSEMGQRAIDMAPVQPHSATREARTCESCHSDPKALGYGIQNGRYQQRYPEDIVVDLELPGGEIWAEQAQIQIPAIPELDIDWSQIVTPEGEQLQIVGSHWPDSGPLTEAQRIRMERTGVCMGCHRNMVNESFWTDEVVAKYGRVITDDEHIAQMDRVLQEATAAEPNAISRNLGIYFAAIAFVIGIVGAAVVLQGRRISKGRAPPG